MKSDFTLRRATRADAGAIHRLIVELSRATGLPHKVSSTAADFRAHGFGDDAAFEALLAESAGDVVGMALWFYTFSTWRGERGVYLQDLVVSERARGRGLGRQLLAAVAQITLEAGATHIRLSVDIDNAGAMRFYRSCGFAECTDERIYMIDGRRLAALEADA
ncbi:MAG: GNAT family N-acetyltransferase [Woeseiaceae bacterium]|nr:GNAT family N-acetyltransferase [Woeseiaceae bacterium]